MGLFNFSKTETPTPTTPTIPSAQGLTFDLSKGPAKLDNFQAINLTKSDSGLTDVNLAAGWDPINGIGKNVDLDLSVHGYDANGNFIDKVYFGNKRAIAGITHSGDNLTGAGDGDDEVIHIDLNAIPSNFARLDITVTSFTKVRFRNIANAFVRFIDNRTGREVVRYDLTGHGGDNTGVHFGRLIRNGNEWTFQAVGNYSKDSVNSFDKTLKGAI